MSKHTPGPWVIEHDSDGESYWRAAIVAGDVIIADYVGSEHSDKAWFNAHLIAAAPDLLAALQSARFAMSVQRALEAQTNPKRAAHWNVIMDAATAAIAKAEGQ